MVLILSYRSTNQPRGQIAGNWPCFPRTPQKAQRNTRHARFPEISGKWIYIYIYICTCVYIYIHSHYIIYIIYKHVLYIYRYNYIKTLNIICIYAHIIWCIYIYTRTHILYICIVCGHIICKWTIHLSQVIAFLDRIGSLLDQKGSEPWSHSDLPGQPHRLRCSLQSSFLGEEAS